jgi:hypothetical protein
MRYLRLAHRVDEVSSLVYYALLSRLFKDHNIPVSAGVVALLGPFDPEDEDAGIF